MLENAPVATQEGEAPAAPSSVLELKDLYIKRPLPHVIGTVSFLNDDNLGLQANIDVVEDDAASEV